MTDWLLKTWSCLSYMDNHLRAFEKLNSADTESPVPGNSHAGFGGRQLVIPLGADCRSYSFALGRAGSSPAGGTSLSYRLFALDEGSERWCLLQRAALLWRGFCACVDSVVLLSGHQRAANC